MKRKDLSKIVAGNEALGKYEKKMKKKKDRGTGKSKTSDFTETTRSDKNVKLKELLGEFKTGTKNFKGKYSEIFVNPERKEMDVVSSDESHFMDYRGKEKKLRFIAGNGKVYVFSSTLLHENAAHAIGLPEKDENRFEGVAAKKGNKWICVESHIMDEKFNEVFDGKNKTVRKMKKYLNQNFNYINKYIDINVLLEEYKDKLRKNHYRFKNI